MTKPRKDFWEFVDRRSSQNGCWLWMARKGRGGYGIYQLVGGKSISAHRYAWSITHGAIPQGKIACHKCDNPQCVNPDHIFIGTYLDNSRDMVSKGRQRKPPPGVVSKRNLRKGLPAGRKFAKGESHPSHKLIEDDVVAIRSFAGFLKNSEIAKIYGLSRPTVSSIVKRDYWAHVA